MALKPLEPPRVLLELLVVRTDRPIRCSRKDLDSYDHSDNGIIKGRDLLVNLDWNRPMPLSSVV